MARHLNGDVSSSAETVEPESLGHPREFQRTVADEACAKERSRGDVGEAVGKAKAEASIGPRHLGIAAIDLIAGEACTLTEILAPRAAVNADAARPPEPGYADAITRLKLRHFVAD